MKTSVTLSQRLEKRVDDHFRSISQECGFQVASAACTVGANSLVFRVEPTWGTQSASLPFLLEDFNQATYFLLPLSLHFLIWKVERIIFFYKIETSMYH